MAATKTDPFAAKQAKQKKILIGLSIVLVAVLAIQLPRMLGGSSSSAAAPTEGTAGTPGVVADATATAAAASAASTASATPAYGTTAAPTLTASSTPQADTAQLASFSLFETKDPFVQQIVEQPAGGAAAAPAGGGAKATAAGGGIASGGSDGKAAAEKMTNATISVNGDPQALALEDTFPEDDPMFVLAGLKPKQARIGIAGGSLKDGKTVALQLGKKLTLVDSATGARYTLELLYVGTAPEETAEFTGEPQQTQPTP